jgi:predicted dinucleotide-binding enzyme
MNVAVLGVGRMGGALARLWHDAGHNVVLTYTRDPERLGKLARALGANAGSADPREAAERADVVLLATHWEQAEDALRAAGASDGALSGRVLIDCTNPMSSDDSELVLGLTTSGGERVAELAPGARVVKAFNTLTSELLRSDEHEFTVDGVKLRATALLCGDDDEAKGVVSTLVRDAGFEPADVGPLSCSRYLEPFALVVASLAYEQGDDPEIAFRLLGHREPARTRGA